MTTNGGAEETELDRAFEAWWDRGDPNLVLDWSKPTSDRKVKIWKGRAGRAQLERDDFEQIAVDTAA